MSTNERFHASAHLDGFGPWRRSFDSLEEASQALDRLVERHGGRVHAPVVESESVFLDRLSRRPTLLDVSND